MKQQQYSIGEVAKITGVSMKKIRYWQSRGYLKDDNRVVCGKRAFRFFTMEEVKQIKAINLLLQKGYTLSTASRLNIR